MVITFTRQLYVLLKAGIPLLRALQILNDQLTGGRFHQDIDGVIQTVQEGRSFSEALSQSRYFSDFYVNMVKGAEVSGNMTGVFKELSEHLVRQQRITRQVQSAFMYPLLVMIMAGTIVTVLLLFVVPIFVRVFEDLGGTLPPATIFLINLSRFAVQWGWLVLAGMVMLVIGLILVSRRETGRYYINKLLWRIPVLGKLLKLVHLGRFCRTLGTLLSSGVPLIKALDVLEETTLSVILRRAIADIRSQLESGTALSSAMEETGVFPLTLVRMIQVGEESGKITDLFLDTAQDYEEEVSYAVSGFLSLLEPVLIIIMGAIVGFIVVALFFPIFSMGTLLK
ncbi:MAG: type II secretion system F family protein [Candidatus Omnitrophica bacterium]|nr:type II secretion system F family protein [Candidatus Omnitrophota bacterium]